MSKLIYSLSILTPHNWKKIIHSLPSSDLAQVLVGINPADLDQVLVDMNDQWKDALKFLNADQMHIIYNASSIIKTFCHHSRDKMLSMTDIERAEIMRHTYHKHKYIFIDISPSNMVHMIHGMSTEEKRDIIIALPDENKLNILKHMTVNEIINIIHTMHGHVKDDMLRIIPDHMMTNILEHMNKDDMNKIIDRMSLDRQITIVHELSKA